MRVSWFIGLWLLLVGVPAWSGEAEAERYRLSEELLKLAQKNAWTGVERTFQQLDALPLEIGDHVLGAQAAMEAGDMHKALARLQIGLRNAEASDDPNSPFQQAKGMEASLRERYGTVHIVLYDDSKIAALFRNPLPFSAQERQAISFAQARLSETRAFLGMLPLGTYRLDDVEIVVEAGTAILEVRIPDVTKK
jgi:hypothetical protein